MKYFISACFFLLSFNLLAETKSHPICQNDLESLPILQDGRIKPLRVHASESLKFLIGKTSFKNFSSTETYCLLSLSSGPKKEESLNDLSIGIEHIETKKLLGLDGKHPQMTYQNLFLQKDLIRKNYMMRREDDSYKKDLNKLLQKIALYEDIKNGGNWFIPSFSSGELKWLPLFDYFSDIKMQELMSKNEGLTMPQILHLSLKLAEKEYREKKGEHYLIELTYIKSHLIELALISTLLALGFLIAISNLYVGLSFTALTVLLQIAIVTFRVIISGRAPVTNMYETVLFSGLGSLLLALIIGHFKQEKRYLVVGLCYNLCSLMMLIFADGMLNASIGPLVPVLRDNFWLSTHVSTVILSYGAFGLSWMMANFILVQKKLGKIPKKDEHYFSDLIYACLKVGTVLLALGVILGGVWADYSWGRFWGWDPKETWSLIVLCLYTAILHGKSTSWIPAHRFVLLTAGAFMSVMMAWFGVNYILATGLHSYGFSEGGAIFLGTFFILQTVILLWAGYKKPGAI